MSRTLVAVACAAFALAQGETGAQVARVEYHPFNSITLTDAELLTGKEGKLVTLAGELRVPRPGSDRLAAVILLHGGSGVGGAGWMIDEWSRELNSIGVATFAVDSLSGRGLATAVGETTRFGRLAMMVDAYRALELLAKHARIDPNRIAVMGFSRGGNAALYASLKRFQKIYGPAGNVQFAAYIAFYPNCVTTYRADEDVSDKPIRIHHGAADEDSPIARCKAYAERLAKAGRDVRLIEYAGAHHVFDAPFFRKPVVRATARYPRRCQLLEGDQGQIINRETQQPFSMSDACVEQGATLAYDEAASTHARKMIREFVGATLAPR